MLVLQKGGKVCLEFRALEKMIPDKATCARSSIPRLTLNLIDERKTCAHRI